MRWLESDGTPHESFSELVGNAMLSESGANRLFTMAGRDLEQLFELHGAGTTGGFDLGISATLSRRSEQSPTSSPNVIGMIRGSDPKLRHEYIIYTAHLDHLGIRPGTAGDDIHNGAYDNAAGVAAVLEIVDAVSRLKIKPRRSILFAAVTAEEKGLLGSDYLAHHPPVPITSLVANINIDMPYLGFPVADVEGFGVEHSTLHDALRTASARLGVALTPDPRPDLVRLIRSDQFSFVRQGVPGLNLKAGSRSSEAAIDGAAMRDEYLRVHYHRPSDDLGLSFSHEGAARFVRVALLLGLTVAQDSAAPRWIDGDFFGARFGPLRSHAGGSDSRSLEESREFPTMTKFPAL
jgi:Zn-dependent M28 family amino/carboxypeptidase